MNGALNIHSKVAGGGLSGALALVILAVVGHWLTISPEVAAGITAIVGFVGSWLAPVIAANQPGVSKAATKP